MTREEARQIQNAKDAAWLVEHRAKTAAIIASLNANKPAPVVAAKPRTFEVDGEQIPYEVEKCNDTQISNAWLAIAKANR